MRKVYYLILTLFLIFCNSYSLNANDFKLANKIINEFDLDGDGIDELVPKFENLSGTLKIFYKDGSTYKEALASGTAEVGSDTYFMSPRQYNLKDKNGNVLVIVAHCYKMDQQRSYDSGNIILIYQFKAKKLLLTKYYLSEYSIIKKGMKKILDSVMPLLQLNMASSIDQEGETLLLYTNDYAYLLDSKGNIKPLGNLIPKDHNVSIFSKKNGDIEMLLSKPKRNMYTYWNVTSGNKIDFEDADIKSIQKVKIDKKNKEIVFEGYRNGREMKQKIGHKKIFSYDEKQKKVKAKGLEKVK